MTSSVLYISYFIYFAFDYLCREGCPSTEVVVRDPPIETNYNNAIEITENKTP